MSDRGVRQDDSSQQEMLQKTIHYAVCYDCDWHVLHAEGHAPMEDLAKEHREARGHHAVNNIKTIDLRRGPE